MSFKSKLLLILCSTSLALSVLAFTLFRGKADQIIDQELAAKALSIAATAASVIDAHQHQKLQQRNDENSPEYKQIKEQLRRIRDNNRRADTYVDYIYTIFESSEQAGLFLAGVDPEESLENHLHLTDVLHGDWTKSLSLSQANMDARISSDQYGEWLRALYPIRDSAGKAIGLVNVELNQKAVLAEEEKIEHIGFLICAIALALALVAALIITKTATRPLSEIQVAVEQIQAANFSPALPLKRKDEFGSLAKALANMASGLKEREVVKSAFARYVSQQVLEDLLVSQQSPIIQGERRRITVLFSDVRGFTAIAEKLPPEKVVAFLNEYFESMVDIIFRHKGTLDKFIGDGLMAIFGAPVDDAYQEENALKAAIEMIKALELLKDRIKQEYGIELKIGIGLNSGHAIVGNIGSSRRMEYTAVGDCVNLAARLESKTKEIGTSILISEYTYNAIRGNFNFQKVGALNLSGREEPIMAYAVQ